MLANVRRMGAVLSKLLRERIADHPCVGDIRGRGLFWGIEFVMDKSSAIPFPASRHVAMEISELGLDEKYSVAVYPGSGTVDGVHGDHIILSPPYNITQGDIEYMVDSVGRLIEDYFSIPTEAFEVGAKL